MKPPVSTLTEDEAVAELADIMDARPADEEVLAVHHWQRDNSIRARLLEAHIMQIQKLGKPQDAPPPQLQPEPAPAPAATKEKFVPTPKTPKEKMETRVAAYARALENVKADPANRELRNLASKARSNVTIIAKSMKLVEPALEPLPALPDPKRRDLGTRLVELPPKNDAPGPYVAPTPADLREILAGPKGVQVDLGALAAPTKAQAMDKLMVKLAPSDELLRFLADARTLLPAWLPLVQDELARARAKFPKPDHLTLAMAEESGEVVKAMLDLRAGKGTKAELHAEIIQTIAMCVRLLEEGDPAVLGEAG